VKEHRENLLNSSMRCKDSLGGDRSEGWWTGDVVQYSSMKGLSTWRGGMPEKGGELFS
jgi:hypothetical protein